MAETLGFREVRPAHCNALLNSYATALGELNYWSQDPETHKQAEDAGKRVELLASSLVIFGLSPEGVKAKRYTPPNTRLIGAALDRVVLKPLKLGQTRTLGEMVAVCLAHKGLANAKTERQLRQVELDVTQRLARHVAQGLVIQTGEHYQFSNQRQSR
jgi:hypothetical protein